jgi:two-component system sensor histidine kinase UhpB
MTKQLKILHLEDLPDDAELVARELKKSNINGQIMLVNKKDDFVHALKKFSPDIILSDHSLPSFDSLDALQILKKTGMHIPFILVTAAVSEEYAVNIMKEGAMDYILKDRLQRLPNAIRSALEKIETEVELSHPLVLQQKLITETSIQVQEQEREEIARELHDNINQILAASKLYLEHSIKNEGFQSESLQKGLNNVILAIAEIRQLSHLLIAPSLGDVTLIGAIKQLMENIRFTQSVKLELNIKNYNEGVLNKELKLMFYRIIQEQFNNILKHARASHVIVKIDTNADKFILSIKDNGIGFDTSKNVRGIGLRNIRNRASFYDGITNIFSSPGKGCTLEVSIPAKAIKR